MQIRSLSALSSLAALPCNGSTTFVLSSTGRQASPCSLVFLGKFQGLQRAINAYVLRHGVMDTIEVDGDIGPITTQTAHAIWEHGSEVLKVSGWPTSPPQSANDLASRVDLFITAFSNAAQTSVSTKAEPAAQNPSNPDTSDFKPPTGAVGESGIGAGVILAAAAAAGLVYYVAKKRKRY